MLVYPEVLTKDEVDEMTTMVDAVKKYMLEDGMTFYIVSSY